MPRRTPRLCRAHRLTSSFSVFMSGKRHPLNGSFSFGNKSKLGRPKSGEYGACLKRSHPYVHQKGDGWWCSDMRPRVFPVAYLRISGRGVSARNVAKTARVRIVNANFFFIKLTRRPMVIVNHFGGNTFYIYSALFGLVTV